MKRIKWIAVVLFCSLSTGLYAQMTDNQVIEYVKSAAASGKSQDTITKELLARGVTLEQAERIKNQMQGQSVTGQAGGQDTDNAYNRNSGAVYQDGPRRPVNAVRREADVDTGSSYEGRMTSLNGGHDLDDLMGNEGEETFDASRTIFGHDIFSGQSLSFEPNENLATPENYLLGPGDQLQIDVYGYNEASYSKTISPEGTINISQVGQIQLGGLTIKEAREKLRKALVSKYASIGGSRPNTSVSITLRNIRTIQVNVMGEVNLPGTFRLSPFSTVFNALYHAGGVTVNGTLRAIKVIRGGEQIATVDVYGYLFDGRSDSDITLREGDIVIVPTYVDLVRISGNVKRPMYYELSGRQTLSDLVDYAGGFTSEAYQDDFRVIRRMGDERQVFTVSKDKAPSFALADGDAVFVSGAVDRFANKVEIKGAVFRPGLYELGGDIATVRQLVRSAGGLKEDAFTGRAVLVREKADLTFESQSIDLAGILSGGAEDILLRKNDILTISSNSELFDPGTLTINGYVRNPGIFPYSDNTTVEDLILLAGGLLDGASYSRVDVARRVSDPYGLAPKDSIGQTYSFALKDGLAMDGGDRFVLQPYDVVSVRRSPAYRTQRFVTIDGEVAFPGSYVLLTEGERLSDLVKRAGGSTSHAFLHGATLTRRMDDEERTLQQTMLRMVNSGTARDTLNLNQIRLGDSYSVGIELDKAVQKPGSEFDLVLRSGDRIYVPERLSTVRISGAVMYPNTTVYIPGKSLNYYIDAAGGFGARARKARVYIVYMNGRVQRAGSGGAKIEPGCEIIVPQRPERAPMSTAEILSMSSSATSLATMVATLVNLFTR
ncbi:MAG: SLBB domain-containing protein [Bacteroidales bacterium]|nr:SLBB domain-containing protein [Bacteroidales bacterium]